MKRLLLALATLVGVASPSLAADPAFVDFAIKQAHARGFTRCDAAIRDVLRSASGDDIRVMTDTLKGIDSDQLQLAAVFGRPGDSVLSETSLRAKGGRCYSFTTSTLVLDGSCDDVVAQSAFSVRATTIGVRFAKNPGGTDALLRPAGDHCIVTYRRGNVF